MGRTDSYSQVNGLQLDQPPTLGPLSVKTVVVLPSHSAAGAIQFQTRSNVTGSLATPAFYFFTSYHCSAVV